MLNVGIAGLGTVGGGVVRLLRKNADLIASRAGMSIMVKAISGRDHSRQRDFDISGLPWADNAVELARRNDIDVVVEAIGGAVGIAREVAETTLKADKHLITANKALIAAHGVELAALAQTQNKQLAFEAAIGGGIPVLKALREGLAANQLSIVGGILNGTCNYILTRMRVGALSFNDALAEAQLQGYAEADPSADIDGIDTANKLTILAALAFGTKPDTAMVRTNGIRQIKPIDLLFAEELGCRIKLLGTARLSKAGLEQIVSPTLVAKTSPLADVEGTANAVLLRGDATGPIVLEGQGAGAMPTASAIVADLIDLAKGYRSQPFGIPPEKLIQLPDAKPLPCSYYLRLQVVDKPGVVADIGGILRDEAISIASLLQRGAASGSSVPVVITTHEADNEGMARAMIKIAGSAMVVEPPTLLRTEHFMA